MKQILEYLQQLNFSKIEANFYIILLQYGPMTTRELAEKAKMNRTAAYPHINALINKSIIAEIIHESRKKLVASEPERLAGLIANQEYGIQKLKTQLPAILISLNSLPRGQEVVEKSEIQYYKGIINARKIYEEALRAEEMRSYIRIDRGESLFSNNSNVFSKAFKENKKLKIWEIIYDVESSAPPSEASRSQIGRYFYKYMPKSQQLSSEDILIYDGKVAIINFRGGKTSIVLQSYDLYNNFKNIFNYLWDMLPESKPIR